MVSGVQRRELFLDHLDQLSHAVAVKDEARARGLVEVRQRSGGPERKRLVRLSGLALSVAGGGAMVALLVRFILSVARNDVEGSGSLTHIPEYYLQIGAYYSRGFTTGFFLCYFLMLFAVIAGSWVDERLKARRAAAARAQGPEATPAISRSEAAG